MVLACLALIPLALLVSLVLTLLVRRASRRARAFDSAGVPGQLKAPRRSVPNTGGIAIFWTIAGLLGILLIGASILDADALARDYPAIAQHLPGLRRELPLAILLLACLLALHLLGLIDDRKPLGPFLKLLIMLAPALAIPLANAIVPSISDTRALTFLDSAAQGRWLSVALTAVWFLVVTNAFNFIDNMDGLSAGVGAIASACFMAAALVNGQWFVAGMFAVVLGTLLGFLIFNFPFTQWNGQRGGASIFMGDSGSIVLGFLVAFLAIRLTYVPVESWTSGTLDPSPGGVPPATVPWHKVLTPLVILAVPLYDFASVVLIRLSQGKSPFVGDMQHFSHRIADRIGSRRAAVLVIYLFALATGLSGVLLSSVLEWHGAVIIAQTGVLLAALAFFEWSERRKRAPIAATIGPAGRLDRLDGGDDE